MCVNNGVKCRRLIVFTSAGKPIYSYGIIDPEMSNILSSSLIAVLSKLSFAMSTKNYNDASNKPTQVLDHLKWMSSDSHQVVFLERKGIFLCCISSFPRDPVHYLKGLLEHVYYQIIMILTGSIHKILDSRPNFDIRQMLSNSDINILDQCVNSAQTNFDSVYYFYNFNINSKTMKPLTSTIKSDCFPPVIPKNLYLESLPIEWRYRKEINKIISGVKIEELLGGILFESKKLVTWFGSKYIKDLPSAEFSLLKNIASIFSNKGTLNNELWIPICLPTISIASYIYCYIQYWSSVDGSSNTVSDTCFILLSSCGDTSIFEKCSAHSTNCRKTILETGYYNAVKSSEINTLVLNNILNRECNKAEILHIVFVSLIKNNYVTSKTHHDIHELKNTFKIYYELLETAHSQIRMQKDTNIIMSSTQKFKYLVISTNEYQIFSTFSSDSNIDETITKSITEHFSKNNKHFFV
ncbi:putative SAND protein [Cryptosporidium canis]|uniref:SAND protein n=1 Tax=Cryptosporidium canis TaxID=195482 RepID=A0ABQ8P716_9CRYT|nr:putative SAND protein [Cryptosporidium canis]KAJ1613448.1 putative SAND protein [Cryptosporidium canis]